MKLRRILVLSALAGILCLHCSKSVDPDPPPSPMRTPADLTAVERNLIESSSGFGLKLFRKVAESENDSVNIFISPLSVSYALGMTYNGAAGDTRDAMAATLEVAGLSMEEFNQSYKSLTELLTGLDETVVFNIANSIWYRQGKPVAQEFIDINRDFFNAVVKAVNFLDPATVDEINDWVETNTNGKITEMIKPPIPAHVAVMLINAICFKGAWTHPFDSADTRTAPFYLADGSEVDCQMMYIQDSIRWFHNDIFQAVDVPYGDEYFSMAILLPRPSHSVSEIVQQLTPENWAAWMASFRSEWLMLHLPRFKFEYEIKLNEALEAMGMGIAFYPGADFTQMFDNDNGIISEVRHKAFVEVNEEGTEAAAATVVIIIDSLGPGLNANRPFLFVIHERESGTILFMGKVANPA